MLTCVTPVGWLERMTQYKAKSAKPGNHRRRVAAISGADGRRHSAVSGGIVPVGDDQSQHLELARDIAQRFNSLYGDTFVDARDAAARRWARASWAWTIPKRR